MERFEGQREGENVLFVFRRHILAMRKGFLGLLIPFAIGSLPAILYPYSMWLLWISLGGFVVGLLLFFYHWIGWFFSVYIVTDQRIQQVTQNSLFGKTIIDLNLTKIQNISYTVPGFSGEVFNFGTIVIQTYVGDLIIDKVYKPGEIYNNLQQAVYEHGGKVEKQDEELPEA